MKFIRLSKKGLRGEWAEWRANVSPLARRLGPRWGIGMLVLGLLWVTGAHYSARYDALAPRVDLARINLCEYVQRDKAIPEEKNAAIIYTKVENRLTAWGDKKTNKDEAQRIVRNFEDDSYKPKDGEWQTLAAYTAETDSIIGEIRAAEKCPECVFRLSYSTQGNGDYTYYAWAPSAVGDCLIIRACVAARSGNAPAWQQAALDLLGFADKLHRDTSSQVLALERRVLKGFLLSLDEAFASGAAGDDTFLARLDERLAAMRPMEGLESLLSLAWSSMDFQRSLHFWNTYPRFFSRTMLTGERDYGKYVDVPYRAAGFSARDRALTAWYLNRLLGIIRSGQPDAYARAWAWMSGPGRMGTILGREFAPRYNELSSESQHIEWSGAPGTLYANAAFIRLARAVIEVIRHGRDEKGEFLDAEHLTTSLHDLPCPMTGGPVVCKRNQHRCELWYNVCRVPWVSRNSCVAYASLEPANGG